MHYLERLASKLKYSYKATQEPGIELGTVVRLYDSHLTYLSEIGTQFNSFELKAKELSECDYKNTQTYEEKISGEDSIDATADTVSNMCASDRFPTQTFYPIIDKLIKEMGRRREAYSMLDDRFGFLVDKSMSRSELFSKARSIIDTYSSDLEEYFIDEFLLFSNMHPERQTVNEMLELQIQNGLIASFPNLHIALRIYLSLFVTSCKGERSFSKLKRIKNFLRSTMGQDRLSSLPYFLSRVTCFESWTLM